jgi:hypothetical protein
VLTRNAYIISQANTPMQAKYPNAKYAFDKKKYGSCPNVFNNLNVNELLEFSLSNIWGNNKVMRNNI